jgi:hypothetical protein
LVWVLAAVGRDQAKEAQGENMPSDEKLIEQFDKVRGYGAINMLDHASVTAVARILHQSDLAKIGRDRYFELVTRLIKMPKYAYLGRRTASRGGD